jgi:hypothetical protein
MMLTRPVHLWRSGLIAGALVLSPSSFGLQPAFASATPSVNGEILPVVPGLNALLGDIANRRADGGAATPRPVRPNALRGGWNVVVFVLVVPTGPTGTRRRPPGSQRLPGRLQFSVRTCVPRRSRRLPEGIRSHTPRRRCCRPVQRS